MDRESPPSILVTRNPNWSQRSGTETGCVKERNVNSKRSACKRPSQEDEKTEKSVTWNESALVVELTAACGGGRALFQAAMLLLQFFFLLPTAFCYLCPSPSFVLLFPVYGLAVVEEPAVSVFSSLFVMSYFSSPSLVLLALAMLMVAGWVVVAEMRLAGGACCSLFSSPACRGASLCFSVFLFLSILCLFFYLLDDDGAVGGDWEERWRRWWRLCGPQPVVLPLLSSVVEERFTIPCTSTGHGGRGMGLLPFVMVGRHGSPVFSINEGMGCVSS
ncbi:hypothetical protein NC652_037616 [Populus alba x Populus x berolinensis]|nr:hypothetical protein NC652_037616 [Populus alba x Populus x berolinensis]